MTQRQRGWYLSTVDAGTTSQWRDRAGIAPTSHYLDDDVRTITDCGHHSRHRIRIPTRSSISSAARRLPFALEVLRVNPIPAQPDAPGCPRSSEEHTSELQSLMRISYDFFCLNKTTHDKNTQY